MVKKYLSKKSANQLKKINIRGQRKKRVYENKRIKYKKLKNNNLGNETENRAKNEETNNIFVEAQSAIKINCCVCNKNISDQIKIILESSNQKTKIYQKGLSFNVLCLRCFILKTKYNTKESTYYVGNEITLNNYKYEHYRILNKMNQNLFTSDWTLGDEIKLLGAIQRLGLENWEEISKILGKGKFECEAHYYTFYYKSKDDYYPSEKIININNNSKNLLNSNKKEENKYLSKIQDNIGYIPFTENNKPNRSISKNIIKKDEQDKNKPVNQNIYDNLGYWVNRKEYDVEFKNEAEIQLSEIEFKDTDTPEQININNKSLKNYNNILDEREDRKKFVEQKNLFDVRKQINFDKKLSNQDREIYQHIKYSLKYLTKEQFFFVFESNVLEKNLKARLNQLLFYKRLGCTTYDDIQKYINDIKKENLKKKEENQKDDDKRKLRTSTIISTNKLSEIYKKEKQKKKGKVIKNKLKMK